MLTRDTVLILVYECADTQPTRRVHVHMFVELLHTQCSLVLKFVNAVESFVVALAYTYFDALCHAARITRTCAAYIIPISQPQSATTQISFRLPHTAALRTALRYRLNDKSSVLALSIVRSIPQSSSFQSRPFSQMREASGIPSETCICICT